MTEPSVNDGFVNESECTSFITLCIECNLVCYVEAKLKQRPNEIKDKKGRPLLHYALMPMTNSSRVRRADSRYKFIASGDANLSLVKTLLQHGADPNEEFTEWPSPWEYGLDARPGFPSSSWDGDIPKLLIYYGADPFVGIMAPKKTHARSALFQVRCKFENAPQRKEELITALKARGGRYFEGEEIELDYQRNLHGRGRDSRANQTISFNGRYRSSHADQVDWTPQHDSILLQQLIDKTIKLGNARDDPFQTPSWSRTKNTPSLIKSDLSYAHHLVHGTERKTLTENEQLVEIIQFHIRRLEDVERFGDTALLHYVEILDSLTSSRFTRRSRRYFEPFKSRGLTPITRNSGYYDYNYW
ncbi:hypothetical protein LTR84_003037 [Exophiala bonariae]|uniref:Ankyrin repeat protein n=1 Tax=Exophiala bonariae TaxID=1690606 RepID=A0AAV9N7V0_9EURO|nr:hypothetical protein LTR84_003037 [Exophiala bonariae]